MHFFRREALHHSKWKDSIMYKLLEHFLSSSNRDSRVLWDDDGCAFMFFYISKNVCFSYFTAISLNLLCFYLLFCWLIIIFISTGTHAPSFVLQPTKTSLWSGIAWLFSSLARAPKLTKENTTRFAFLPLQTFPSSCVHSITSFLCDEMRD